MGEELAGLGASLDGRRALSAAGAGGAGADVDEEALGLGASLDLAGVVPAGLKVRKRNEEEREELDLALLKEQGCIVWLQCMTVHGCNV